MKKLGILGASGHGKVVADAAKRNGLWDSIDFFDDNYPKQTQVGKYTVIGGFSDLMLLSDSHEAVIAIGDNNVRLQKQLELESNGFNIATVIHPASHIANDVEISPGTVVFAGAIINPGAKVGKACIVNSNAVVEHDCLLSNAIHISPGACLAGGVSIGESSWVGIGSSIIQLINIGKNVIIGAGSTVINDIPHNTTAAGSPARQIGNK